MQDFSVRILLLFTTFLLSSTHKQTYAQTQDKYNLPSNFYEADCIFSSESFVMSITEKERSEEVDVSTYYSAAVGDLNGDGFGEIVIPCGYHNASNIVYIFNHEAKLVRKIMLPGVSMHTDYDSVILADLNSDGQKQIIVSASNGQKLLIYNYEGELLASESFPTKFPKTIGVADFNNDGIPEVYVGNRIYKYDSLAKSLVLLVKMTNASEDNTLEATMAQDIDDDGIPELMSANTSYKVVLNNTSGLVGNSITKLAKCNAINNITPGNWYYMTRTFALADVDLDGLIDVVSLVPIYGSTSTIELTVWNPITGQVKYTKLLGNYFQGDFIRNSWPFIGDTDSNGYPDIIFMGGVNKEFSTLVYRLEYDEELDDLTIRATNDKFNDYSSMSTSMSMFDFNNDAKQEIVYRDETSLYIINGEDLSIQEEYEDCHSGTGWEYPVVASLTPSGESSIIISSGTSSKATTGSLRIYGANTSIEGAKPWMPARKIWNQYSFYQNTMSDNLKVIPNPAPLNVTLESLDGKGTTMQPFNGHMFQLGIIRPSSLESVYPLADVVIDEVDFGYDRLSDMLTLDLEISNGGDAPMDPQIPINIYKKTDGDFELIYTKFIEDVFEVGTNLSLTLVISDFEQYLPFEQLLVKVADGKYDCDPLSNQFIINLPDISNVFYVKKGEAGVGSSWTDAIGELSQALQIAKARNIKYPNSITQLWVAEGSYYGSFEMQEGVNVYGGFSGVEIELKESRPLEFPTILDAQNNGRPLTQLADYNISTEWRGLTLQNGNSIENGGGASLKKGSTLSYSIIRNNKSSATKGGGVYADNSMLINCIVEQNELISNTESKGAGVYAMNGSYVRNNTIVKNAAKGTASAKGSGLYSDRGIICNNIIYKNFYRLDDTDFVSDNIFSQAGTVHHNLADNKDKVDPLFLKFDIGDYRLLPTSPALNEGNNPCITGWNYDIAGNDRIYQSKVVDLGAFEYQAAELVLNADGHFYVNKSKDGNGSDWRNAAKELSDVLIGAKYLNENNSSAVKKIWVANGTYQGSFEMVEGAVLHGGFAGYETDFSQIDTVTNKTYLDAQGLGRVLTQANDFVIPTEWAGVILQNGLESAIDKDVYGGGAYLKKNGAIRYSTIRNSGAIATSINNKVNAYGGAIYLEEGANLLNSIVDGNIAKVDNQSAGVISSGVAQGGGIYSEKNRLAYNMVRNNRGLSNGNTDGSAIYTTGGEIVNNIVNNNKGRSAINLAGNQPIINSTIVENESKYTIVGESSSSVKNSIVYNNAVSTNDFYQIRYDEYNNLINIDPKFEVDNFKLQASSPARAMGNARLFPADLDVDIENKLRYITLNENKKVIDAGAYQSNIKVLSAAELHIEVPFGADFDDLNLNNIISVSLEYNYNIECDVTWLKGVYNGLEAGDYTLDGKLLNLPSGVINPDEVSGSVIVTVSENHRADIEGLMINNTDWLQKPEMEYVMDCESSLEEVPIKITLPRFASFKFKPELVYKQVGDEVIVDFSLLKPGLHPLEVIITSQDGNNIKRYPLSLVKYFPFWDIVDQRWNNSFVVNNNKENNGGYQFTSYKWYKEGQEIGSKQYYSAGNRRTDVLDEASLYYVEMIDIDGMKYTTCKECPVLMSSGIKVYPNPVRIGGSVTIETPIENNIGGRVDIYSISGLVITQEDLTENLTVLDVPSNPGIYIVKVSLKDGVSESIRLVVF